MYLRTWSNLTQDPGVLNVIQGYKIPFTSVPPPTYLPPLPYKEEHVKVISKEIHSLQQKGAVQISTEQDGFISNIFLVPKSGGKFRLILNLKALNKYVAYEHFKMEDMRCVRDLMSRGYYLCKLDLKDAYLSIPIHRSHRKYLQFAWKGKIYEYSALPFGLSAAPRVFTKVMKPALAQLRSAGVCLVAYLDDFLIMGRTKKEAESAFCMTKNLLQSLGFVINLEKSQSQATQSIDFLGLMINSREMLFRLPQTRVRLIRSECKKLLQKEHVTVRELAHTVGTLTATRLAVLAAPLHYRALQAQKTRALARLLSYELTVKLDAHSRNDLCWWINHVSRENGRSIQQQPPTFFIESDASNTGWGARCGQLRTRGQWSQSETQLHINCKEMLAALLALQTFARDLKGVHVRLRVDNTTAVCYINRMGGTHSPLMMELTHKIWNWSLERKILLSAEHLPGKQNQIADLESRMEGDSSEWKLAPAVFHSIMEQLGDCQIDLFASRLTAQMGKYMSWRPDPGAVAVDALAQPWNHIRGYAFPPFALIARCLSKIQQEQVQELVLITPVWPTQPWFPVLLSMTIRKPIEIPTSERLLSNHRGEIHPLIRQGSLNLAAWLVSGDPSKQRGFQRGHQSLYFRPGEAIQKKHTHHPGEDGSIGVR